MFENWNELCKESIKRIEKYPDEYINRLKFELKEINKQGANDYWLELINSDVKYDHNKNGLILPFLFAITEIDPIKGIKKIFVNCNNDNIAIEIDGIEIMLENGKVINTSENTLIKTTKGYIKAKDLSKNDDIYIQ